jgi:hypothetical protein
VEDFGGVEGPVGVSEKFAGEENEVGLAGADDLIGLGGRGDHAYGAGGNVRFAADSLGVMDLVAGANGDLLGGMVAAGGDVDEVDAFKLHEFGEFYGLGQVPARAEGFGSPVGGGDADEDGEMLGPSGADGSDDGEREADAVFKAAAVLVGAVVGEGREEFVEEVTVGGVDLDEVEAGGVSAVGGGDEVGDDFRHADLVEGGGDGVSLIEADGRGGDGLPAAFGGRDGADFFPWNGHAGFAAGVGELGAGVGAVLVQEAGDALELREVLVLPDAEVAGSDAALGADGVGFSDDEGGSADGAAAEVDEMPVAGEAVDRGVLAHGRDGDSVRDGEAAELEGREELVRWLSHTLLDVAGEFWNLGFFGGGSCGEERRRNASWLGR